MTTNYTSWNGIITTANNATDGMLGGILPFIIWLIIFSYVVPFYGFAAAFVTASFIAFACALPLFALGITSGWIMVILMVLTLFGIILIWKR